MRHNSVIVRTKEQLDSMNKELVNALHSIFDNGVHETKACSIVYQFNKGTDGETMMHEIYDEIGAADYIHFEPNGDLVCDVITNDMLRKSRNFKGVIDNFVISKTTTGNGNVQYNLEHFVVYDEIVKKQMREANKRREMVEKHYIAPSEAYTVDPSIGGGVQKMIKRMDSELEKVADSKKGLGERLVEQEIEKQFVDQPNAKPEYLEKMESNIVNFQSKSKKGDDKNGK